MSKSINSMNASSKNISGDDNTTTTNTTSTSSGESHKIRFKNNTHFVLIILICFVVFSQLSSLSNYSEYYKSFLSNELLNLNINLQQQQNVTDVITMNSDENNVDSVIQRTIMKKTYYSNNNNKDNGEFVRYYQVQKLVVTKPFKKDYPSDAFHITSYKQASVITNQTSWFTPKKICVNSTDNSSGGCCATTVAISFNEQDSRNIINTRDGFDLSDIRLQHYSIKGGEKYFSHTLNEQTIPCIQNNTIFHLDNHRGNLEYFYKKVRPKLTMPYLLITSHSDADTPEMYPEKMITDNLLLKWYGTNPLLRFSGRKKEEAMKKFVPWPIGLSSQSHQEQYISSFLSITNYTNPFRNKDRWISLFDKVNKMSDDELFYNEIFVKFGLFKFPGEKVAKRQVVFDLFCNRNRDNSTSSAKIGSSLLFANASVYREYRDNDISCNAMHVKPHEMYAASSTYIFALSPPGVGWDCYRTYELLLLGIIPIIDSSDRYDISTQQLFKDLPVVHMKKSMLSSSTTKEDYIDAIRTFLNTSQLTNSSSSTTDFFTNTYDKGWERLFLLYWRKKVLEDSNRYSDIIEDDQGQLYYQGWQYTPFNSPEPLLCGKPENCN